MINIMENQENFNENSTNSYITIKPYKVTNTILVLEYIYSIQKPVTMKEISEDTGLTMKQVYQAIRYLNGNQTLKKEYIHQGAKRRVPPINELRVYLSKSKSKSIGGYLQIIKRI